MVVVPSLLGWLQTVCPALDEDDVVFVYYSGDGKVVWHLDLGHQLVGIYQSKNRAAYWDRKNNMGERMASGVYFYTLT